MKAKQVERTAMLNSDTEIEDLKAQKLRAAQAAVVALDKARDLSNSLVSDFSKNLKSHVQELENLVSMLKL